MALIKCINCGEEVSEKAEFCPHCKYQFKKEIDKNSMRCPECGKELLNGEEICSNCGYPISIQTEKPDNASKQNVVKNNGIITKKIIAIGITIIVFVLGVVIASQYTLTGDDKVAYDLIINVADRFKSPSSVRLASGCLGVDKDCIFCGISGTNSYGGRIVNYYYISDNGYIYEEEDEEKLYLYKITGELNTVKINKKLEKALKYHN